MTQSPPGDRSAESHISQSSKAFPVRRSLRRVVSALGLVSAMGLAAGLVMWGSRPSVEALISEGERALLQRDLSRAEDAARTALVRDPQNSRALLLAARSAVAGGRFEQALKFYEQIPDDRLDSVAARVEGGDLLLFQLKQLSSAEAQFRSALAQDPENVQAHNRMAYLLGLQSRQWEATAHRLRGLESRVFTPTDLYLLTLGDRALDEPATIEAYFDSSPADPAAQLAMGRLALEQKRYDEAARLLRQATRSAPHAPEAQARLGWLLQESKRDLANWSAELTEGDETHPSVWWIRGAWARSQGNEAAAARCFWESVRRDPNGARANYDLGQALVALRRPDDAAPFLDRAGILEKYARAAELAFRAHEPAGLVQAAQAAETLKLFREAWAWASLSGQRPVEASRLETKLQGLPLERSPPEANPALKIDLSHLPLPRERGSPDPGSGDGGLARPNSTSRDSAAAPVAFEDRAPSVGINFQYVNGGNPAKGLVRMYEVVGGGVAALDYDGDHWPDLHFAQGGQWPASPTQREHLDRLFHNRGDDRFEDVTDAAALIEPGFGQGAAVGDFDGDGFPDLYVANTGPNRLFRNNGDGTFSEVAQAAGMAGDDYSASAVMADLNGDGRPDLYVVNYLAGPDLFERVCGGSDGVPRSCLPQAFDAAPDRFYLNRGDGTFEEATARAGFEVPPGKGLGVIAADLDGTGKLSLYVANDVGPNFLFVNQTPERGATPAFEEQGLLRGVAVNAAGRSESAMGVAAGDADEDGRLDLFITNFEGETNTLYFQREDGQFLDTTEPAGLSRVGIEYVGWGTQFLDGELDGRLDLLLTNGHINNLEDKGKPYQMPTQYLSNVGEGRFVELRPQSLGPFFEGRRLGRGMARLDWNRDGLEDAAISHLDAPAALLTNTTHSTGHVLALRLCGTRSERDAIGATATVTCGGRTLVRQITAGDGNQSSNERRLVFGLGASARIDALRIRWPSGETQEFGAIEGDVELMLIEGSPRVIGLRRLTRGAW